MILVVGIIISYLLGSIPTAFIFGRLLKGIDIREHGSGNVGATNAGRILGRGYGILILALDTLKGVLAVCLVGDLMGLAAQWQRVLLGLTSVAGHNWTVFLGFKGGKGIATSLGVLIGITVKFPGLGAVLAGCLVSWIIIFLLFRYISLASIVAAVVLPLMMLITGQSMVFQILGLIFCFSIVYRHRANIQRLRAGTESRVENLFSRPSKP